MKRSILISVLAALLVVAFSATALVASGSLSNEVKVFWNDRQMVFDVKPRMDNGRVLVPFRAIFEVLGADVEWNPVTKKITATKGKTIVEITINNKTAYKNGHAIALDVAPALVKGRAMVPLRFVSEAFGTIVNWDGETRTVLIENSLPVVGSYQNLKALLAEVENSRRNTIVRRGMAVDMAVAGQSVVKAEAAATPAMQVEAGVDYSTTNIQVQGVDEADVVKTDGKYIYQVNNQRVVVAQVYPASEMTIVSTLEFDGKEFEPRELYVDEKYLVVIGSTYYRMPVVEPAGSAKLKIYPPYHLRQTVKAFVYDIRDKANIKLAREVELEGYYVSSRKIGSALYLVANKHIDYYHIMKQEKELPAPVYRDSAGKDQFTSVDYGDVRYFPGSVEPNFLLIGGLDLDRPEKEMDVSTYLGAGENIYASQKNLYVAVTHYEIAEEKAGQGIVAEPAPRGGVAPLECKTKVYKFALEQGTVKYRAEGNVPGTILNQFSMDEHEGYFRIATTKGQIWRDDEFTSKNNVYILNQDLKITGKIEDIAPGERIYSARFMGDRGYMVTFKTVDPLFVLDLSNPEAPKILGALKIPGYSDYLHPYDENHIIGFGKDTIEIAQKDMEGNERGTMAFYQGMKIAIFDVSDVNNPVEKFKEIIGDRGTDSELLRNHKALLFAKDKNLLAFPITVMEVKDQGIDVSGMPRYGEFAFQGAYVYHIDLVDGFTLKGKITHLTAEDQHKAGRGWYSSDKNIERILYIGDTLYTLSKGMIKASELATLKEINSLVIPQ